MEFVKKLYQGGMVALLGDRVLFQPGWRKFFGLRPPVYRPHPYTLYELNPDWRSSCGRARHNAEGLRGDPIETTAACGIPRILCMGESSTYCTGIDCDADTYPARLEYYLGKHGVEAQVLNGGVGGYTSLENLMHFHMKLRYLNPELVIYYFTHNDVHPRRWPSISPDYREYSRTWHEPHGHGGLRGWVGWSRALGSGDISQLVRRFSEYQGRRPAANTEKNPPTAFRANILSLAHMVHAAGAEFLMVLPNYRCAQEAAEGSEKVVNPGWRAVWEHRDVVIKLAESEKFMCYDLLGNISYPEDPKAFPAKYYRDPVHFNKAGADQMGQVLARELITDTWSDLFQGGENL